METMFWVWLAIIAVTVIIEIVTLDLVSIWFAFGAVIPFILSAIGGIAIEIQIAVFVAVSALLIIFLRKNAQKLLFKNMNQKTNVDAFEGKKVRLLEDTDFEHNGSVKINDVTWTAISESGELIKAGQLVEIKKVDGNKLIVIPVSQETDKTSANGNEEITLEKNSSEKTDENNTAQTEQQIQQSEKTEEGKK